MQGAGHGDGVQAGELVGHEVIVGDAAFGAEALRVGAGVDGAHRYQEAQPVGGGDIAATPPPRQVDAVLGGDKAGIGQGQGFCPQIILPNPAQARPPERRQVRAYQRFQAGVARLAQQHGTQRRRQVLRPRLRFAGMGEGASEAGPSIDFQQQFR